ncbi:MAG: membrane protein insertase YidC [Acidimicrobiales bacterium]|jgi:YidC/Oxa1 family membrane protein insertase
MILAAFYTTAITPFAKLFGWLLAAFYSISGNYGIAIILLTLVTMIIVFPLTRKGTRSMMQMQLLQPELLKLRNKYKKKPGMSAEERREVTTAQQEEMMALYRENGVSPTGGCLPMFMQFPVFIVLYNTIRGMTRLTTVGTGKAARVVADPEFIDKKTRLYENLIHSGGKMEAFGLNLADSVRSHQLHWVDVIPYVIVILVAVALQYVSIWQITNRNPQAGANQQMQQIQKFMPLIFVFIYIEFPAGVGLYFIVSSMFRVGQQEWMYKKDPHIVESMRKLKEMKLKNPPPVVEAPKGWRARLAALAPQADPTLEPSEEAARNAKKPIRKPNQGGRPGQSGRPAGSKPPLASRNGSARTGQGGKPGQAKRPGQPRPGQPRSSQPSKPGQTNRPGQPRSGQPRKPGQAGGNGQAAKARSAPTGQRPGEVDGNGSRSDRPSASGNGAPKSSPETPPTSFGSTRRRGRPR